MPEMDIMGRHRFREVGVTYCGDVIMGAMESQITSFTIVYSTVYSGADQRKHQSSAPLAVVWGIHRWPANCPHKGPVMRNMFPFDDVIMYESFNMQWWYTDYIQCIFYFLSMMRVIAPPSIDFAGLRGLTVVHPCAKLKALVLRAWISMI